MATVKDVGLKVLAHCQFISALHAQLTGDSSSVQFLALQTAIGNLITATEADPHVDANTTNASDAALIALDNLSAISASFLTMSDIFYHGNVGMKNYHREIQIQRRDGHDMPGFPKVYTNPLTSVNA